MKNKFKLKDNLSWKIRLTTSLKGSSRRFAFTNLRPVTLHSGFPLSAPSQ